MYNFFSNLKKCRDNSNLYPTVEVVISSYILENYEEISLMSINLLASRCNTSISTISRFCQKILNCDFKTLKEECKNYERFLKEKEVLKKGIQKNFLYDSVEAIRETADLNSEENYQEIIKLIKRAKKVFFFGSSFSNILAQNASEKFMRLGKITVCPLTSISQEVEVNKVKNDDLVFIVSFSNKNFQMERLKYILRKKKINIVYVTANREKANEMEKYLIVSPKMYQEFESSLIQEMSISYVINELYLRYNY